MDYSYRIIPRLSGHSSHSWIDLDLDIEFTSQGAPRPLGGVGDGRAKHLPRGLPLVRLRAHLWTGGTGGAAGWYWLSLQ